MAFVGEAVLTAFIETLFDKLASSELLQFARQEQVLADIKKWEKTLLKIHAVLDDAEEKQLTRRRVKMWLDDLRDLAYDVEDILDDFATEALGRKLMAETQPSTSKVRRLIPSCCTSLTPSAVKFNVKMRSKIQDITSRLQDISAQKNDLHLAEDIAAGRPTIPREILPTTCLVVESDVCGRETDKAAILDLLLQDHEPSANAVRVIPIIGMGGMGKTTLAQLAYNDDKVQNHFDLKIWACVSDDFDVLRVTKTILQSLASGISDVNDLNQLQLKLKEQLSGKKFLLVLDDVWNQNCHRWDLLYKPIRTGAQGSRVIVTTRNQGVVAAIGASSAYPLKELSNDECLSLFAQQALGRTNFDNHPHLRVVGEEIVKKCKGLPLAAKALGGMLRTKLNHDAWEDILKSKIWDLPEEKNSILPALKLSYHHLPSHLKRCFAYCSIFPKDYKFKVDELVLLWMGEGFLHQVKRQKLMEEIGSEYFYELLARLFFQQSNHNSSQFVMHDLVHDLAQFVAGDVCFNLEEKIENNQQHIISERARHSSFIRQSYEIAGKFKAFGKVKNLRTFVALPINIQGLVSHYISMKVLHGLLMGMGCLRVLSLAGYCINELPDSIGELKHLRYLNFSNCSVERLPDLVGLLYNLQTLILRNCNKLIRLPIGIGKLTNLRHLDIIGTIKQQEMPFQIGNLMDLQILPRFIVSKSGGSHIRGLKNLSNLQGAFSISALHEIVNVEDARNANLKDKQKIEELTMEWSKDFWDLRNDADELHVLESLQPHKNLERLTVAFYGGSKFPSWIGDPSFSTMVELTLKNCNKCMLFPPLGGLLLLKMLRIRGMSEVKSVGAEFYGEYMNPFASLKELRFEDMPEWESWSHPNLIKEDVRVFPNLEKFVIRGCPKLIGELPKCFLSLVELEVSGCPELACPLPELASLRELNLRECHEALLRGDGFDLASLITLNLEMILRLTCVRIGFTRSLVALQKLVIKDCGGLICLWEEQGVPCNLKILRIENCANLEKLPNGLQTLKCLEELNIWRCPKLESFPDSSLPLMRRQLWVVQCESLKWLPHYYNSCALEYLVIFKCPSLVCFPNGELPTTLKILDISDCENLGSLPEGMMHRNSTCWIETLRIWRCPSLKSFPTGELPSTLERLEIRNCSNLESMSENMCSNNSALEFLLLMGFSNLKILPECLNSLKMLFISDCEGLEFFPARGLSTPNLTQLHLSQCKNLKSLPHQMRNLKSLQHLYIWDCPGVESFPEGGLAPNLTSRFVGSCENLKTPISEWGLQSLTSLSSLTIKNMFPDMVSFSDEECLLPISLTSLTINGMESLASLALENLISLQSLHVSYCRDLRSLGLKPATLERLEISDCPMLKERCLKEKGEYWPNIAHIPYIRID